MLKDGGEAGFADGERVPPWHKTQEGEMTVRICGIRLYEIGRQILCFDCRPRDASALLVQDISLDGSRGNLRLTPHGRGNAQRECQDEKRTQ